MHNFGIYCTQGVTAAVNTLRVEQNAAAWKDSAGNSCIFGGDGVGASAAPASLNEVTVVFRPASERALAGAKIAIQQFLLMPRGM